MDIYNEIQQKNEELRNAVASLSQTGREYASAYKTYRILLAKELLRLKNEGITPDPILGFLYNYYKHNFGLSKSQYKKILGTVKDNQVKEFLIEQFKIKNSQTDPSKLVRFLNNLKVEPYNKVVKIKSPIDDVEVLDFN